jgi:hypothetical protein
MALPTMASGLWRWSHLKRLGLLVEERHSSSMSVSRPSEAELFLPRRCRCILQQANLHTLNYLIEKTR